MTVVDTVVEVPEDRRVTLQFPSDLPVGRLRVIAVVATEERVVPAEPPARRRGEPIVVPISNPNLGRDWDPADTFRREGLYGDDGR